uniref:Serine/threonine-protein kinase CTR1 n=1 Tax=Anthurium amnicola TaxID=1678845 RepID=A0A1D1XXR5_9ARAE
MAGEVPGPSGQRFPHNYIPSNLRGVPLHKNVNSVSLQTGEEFSVEFLHDRAASRGSPMRSDRDRAHTKRVGFKFSHNIHPGYEDLTDILGLRRTESDNISDVDMSRGMQKETDARVSRDSSDEAIQSPVSVSIQGSRIHPHSCGMSNISQPDKLKFLCSFGGKILPRPSDGKLRYVGGETRIISISKNLSWQELMQKTLRICNQRHTIKYQLPGEDLDALISVSSAEDLQHMVEEYYGFDKVDGSQRIRIFLIVTDEPENSSFDMRSLQSSSEYQYVVAVNGVSPKKSSSGDSPHQLGHNSDSSSMLLRNAVASFLSSSTVDRTKASGPGGIFLRHPPPQIFVTPQNATHSPTHSPPFSPRQICRESESSEKQSFEDQFATDHLIENYHEMENGHCPYWVPKHHPYLHNDVDFSVRSHGIHSQYCRPIEEISSPFNQNDNNLCRYPYGDKPACQERTFHSEKLSRQQSNSQRSGSNDSVDPIHGMPHALSDTVLQEHVGRNYCQAAGAILPLGSAESQFTEKLCEQKRKESVIIENKEVSVSKLALIQKLASSTSEAKLEYSDSSKLLELPSRKIASFGNADCSDDLHEDEGNADNINSQDHCLQPSSVDNLLKHIEERSFHGDTSGAPEDATYKSQPHGSNYHLRGVRGAHLSSQELDALESSVLVSSFIGSKTFPYILEEQSNCHSDDGKSGIPVPGYGRGKSQPSGYSEKSNESIECKAENVTVLKPPVSWINSSSEIVHTDNFLQLSMKEHHYGENSREMTYVSSSNLTSSLSRGVLSQGSMDHQEHGVSSSASSAPLVLFNNNDQSLNLQTDDPPNWSLLQSPPEDETLIRNVSLLDQDPVNFLSPLVQDMNHEEYGCKSVKREVMELRNGLNGKAAIKALVTVEDVTDSVPSDIPISPTIVPHVMHQATLDDGIYNTSSITLESECEETNADDASESTSDAAIAEIEAGIYGLQIIKNADLEELRELGSGTFGTVYHGKWRGTDVAIKRIRKSCFAGRTSEQERLTKDFWREAQILSKLHHPNVVAFYGVVPDGAGGTLATVTEYMVNGSLKHVLLRKDRSLDLRKRLMIAMDAAFGMEYLHSKDIVHFDLKCDNLLVNMRDSQRPICKVGDFGLSRIKRNTLVSGGVRGTLPWMAPELLNGSSSRVSEKVDVFSFGIALWEILTGEEPYANMHCGAIIGGIVNNTLRPPIPDHCDPEWRKLMEQCWSPDPATRPSFTEITNRLRVMSMALQAKGSHHRNR